MSGISVSVCAASENILLLNCYPQIMLLQVLVLHILFHVIQQMR